MATDLMPYASGPTPMLTIPSPPQRTQQADPLNQLRLIVRMLITADRQLGETDEDIRDRIIMAFTAAAEGVAPESATVHVGSRPMALISSAGMFRLVLAQPGLDRHDRRKQETWLAAVQAELDRVLGQGGGE